MSAQANCEALKVHALAHAVFFGSHRLICLSQQLNIGVVWRELSVSSDDCTTNFGGQVGLFSKGSAEITFYNSLDKGHELASKVVGGFLGHLSWQVIYTGVQNIMLSHIVNLPLEA